MNDTEIEEILEQRDYAEDKADELAQWIAIITGTDIGEHSNINEPWDNAAEAAADWVARHLVYDATRGIV